MEIKILGSGCSRCKALEKSVYNALAEMDLDADVEKVEDINRIIAYGVMQTPALVINQKVIFSGRVPSVSDLKEIITNNMQ
ncbi:MAG TPA: thioredoxin family protein [Bacteroidetes bacterium]|jgi:small redox-active disulfide protein 2|nr:thioredoxin family protein [Bacteroidota bacterium]